MSSQRLEPQRSGGEPRGSVPDDAALDVSERTSNQDERTSRYGGYVDLQINGVDDIDFSRADGDDWVRAGRRLIAAGVTGYLATICSMPPDRYEAALARVAEAQRVKIEFPKF